MATQLSSAPPGGRLHGLDALRAAALLGGIVLHSLMPFLPGGLWLVNDAAPQPWALPVVYLIHLARMVIFMLLAGYFGRMVVQRRGSRSYLRDRAKRILLPAVVFWPIAVLPLGLLAGLNATVNPELPAAVAPPSDAPPILLLFSPGQLWFLLVLMECAVIVVALRAIALRVIPASRRVPELAGAWLSIPVVGPLLAGIPYLAALLVQGDLQMGIIAPPTIVPSVPALLCYGGAFVVGWSLHAHPDSMSRLGGGWVLHLALAVPLSVAGYLLSPAMIGAPAYAALTALAAWTWTFGLVGLCVRRLTGERAWVRYLADASYWLYLVHLPLLVAVEIPMAGAAWSPIVKILIAWVVTAVVGLAGYDLLVRGTWVGGWLNGRRRRPLWRGTVDPPRPAAEPAPVRAGLAEDS